MGYWFGKLTSPQSGSSGGGGGIGGLISYASPAGVVALAAPPGFVAVAGSSGTGRLSVDMSAGDATWQDLTHGADGQQLFIFTSGAGNLTLNGTGFNGAVVIPGGGDQAAVGLLYSTGIGYLVVS